MLPPHTHTCTLCPTLTPHPINPLHPLLTAPQIVDTVDLFHAKRSRKLSLRFLASYLLRATIQERTHDSIEDAVTALRCVRLCACGC